MDGVTEGDYAINAAGSEQTVTEPQSTSTTCIKLKPTTYPIYVTVLLLFVTNSINTMLVSESVLYNKVCYDKFENLTLCTNSTFSRHHPLVQVCDRV